MPPPLMQTPQVPPEFERDRIPDELKSLAAAMDQQAVAARTGTALGGHSDPFYFYSRVAYALRMAAGYIGTNAPAPTPSATGMADITPVPTPVDSAPPPAPPPAPARPTPARK